MKFDQLIESYIIKNTTRMFYPKNLKFSQKFLDAFKEEYNNQKKVIAEGKGKNKSFAQHFERMLKGLRFEAKKIEDGVKEEGRTIGPTPAAAKMKAAVKRAKGSPFKRMIPSDYGVAKSGISSGELTMSGYTTTQLSHFAWLAAKELKGWYGIQITPEQVKRYLFTPELLHDFFEVGNGKDMDTMTRDMLADEIVRKFGNKKAWPSNAEGWSEKQVTALVRKINAGLGSLRY